MFIVESNRKLGQKPLAAAAVQLRSGAVEVILCPGERGRSRKRLGCAGGCCYS